MLSIELHTEQLNAGSSHCSEDSNLMESDTGFTSR